MTEKFAISKIVLVVKLEALFRNANPMEIDEAVAEAKSLAAVKPRPGSPEFLKQMQSEVGTWPPDQLTPLEQLEEEKRKSESKN